MDTAFNRILLKLSGEVLAGANGHGIDFETVDKVCSAVKDCCELGTEIAIVVGGGNFWRGRSRAIWTEQELTIWVCLPQQ